MCIEMQPQATLPDSAQLLHHNQHQEMLFNPSHQDSNENTDLFSQLFPEECKLPFCLQLFDSAEQVVTDQPRTNTKMRTSFILIKGVLT